MHHEPGQEAADPRDPAVRRHSDINPTKEYYLSVQDADAKTARREQKKLLGELKCGDPTDPKLTPKAQKRAFPGRKRFKPLVEDVEM